MGMYPRTFSGDTEAPKSYLPSVSCCNLALEGLYLFTIWGREEIGGNMAGKEIHEEKQIGFEHMKHPWTCIY